MTSRARSSIREIGLGKMSSSCFEDLSGIVLGVSHIDCSKELVERQDGRS